MSTPSPTSLRANHHSSDLSHTFSDEYHLLLRQDLFAALIEVVSGSGQWSEQTATQIRGMGFEWAERRESLIELPIIAQSVIQYILERTSSPGPARSPTPPMQLTQRLIEAGHTVTEALTCGFFEYWTYNSSEPPT
ncbi:hypothetical protein PV350_42665 [Streptomyces sp. PA03-6a]|nr:hypothetical protein [Streptomyces sp. PA03-6a]